jgi:hypothetical protein
MGELNDTAEDTKLVKGRDEVIDGLALPMRG